MDKSMLRINLLLDDVSRSKLKVNISDLIMYDVNIITNLRELTEDRITHSNRVVILEDFLRRSNVYSDLVLYKKTFGLDYIFISIDDGLLRLMCDISQCFRMEPSLIDYDKLYSIVKEDVSLQERFIVSGEVELEVREFAEKILGNAEYDDEVRKLADNFLSLLQMVDDRDKERTQDRKLIEQLSAELQYSSDYANTIERMYLNLLHNAKGLNRTLKQYEAILSRDVYDKVILSKYTNRPTILYLKEYEELLHFDSFLETLYEVFRWQYKRSAKILRLYDSSRSRRTLTIPDYYKVIHKQFSRREVISEDFVAKTGNYKEILDLLLTNHNRLDVLIIVDCRDHSDTVVSGQCLHLSVCRNVNNLPVYGLDKVSTIVNNDPDNPMSWDHYSNYSDMEDSERLLFLTSRPVMQTIYELNQVFSQIGV